jgi:hypothetical protein
LLHKVNDSVIDSMIYLFWYLQFIEIDKGHDKP